MYIIRRFIYFAILFRSTSALVLIVTRELGKTSYKGVRMTILGSREHTCVHPTISKLVVIHISFYYYFYYY